VTVVERDPLRVLQRRGERVLRVRAPLRLPPERQSHLQVDVGDLSYDDPLHPHAITGAGTDTFAHDAVGNQTARPGGTTVRYTPFDLPARITQGASTIAFGYDGDQQRIRKTTPEKETLYFSDLYERVTEAASGAVEHRYHVHSPERLTAMVTRGGDQPDKRYVHVDHLGSVDALTGEDGASSYARAKKLVGQAIVRAGRGEDLRAICRAGCYGRASQRPPFASEG
jgi:YD repeat-containing protein